MQIVAISFPWKQADLSSEHTYLLGRLAPDSDTSIRWDVQILPNYLGSVDGRPQRVARIIVIHHDHAGGPGGEEDWVKDSCYKAV